MVIDGERSATLGNAGGGSAAELAGESGKERTEGRSREEALKEEAEGRGTYSETSTDTRRETRRGGGRSAVAYASIASSGQDRKEKHTGAVDPKGRGTTGGETEETSSPVRIEDRGNKRRCRRATPTGHLRRKGDHRQSRAGKGLIGEQERIR